MISRVVSDIPTLATTRVGSIGSASRTELVAEAIKGAILDGRIAPGQPVVERELAQQFGVSKTPVREALRILLATGLLTMHPYRGVSVQTVDRDMVRSLYGVRALLEPRAVALAVPHQTAAALNAAEQTLRQAATATQPEERSRLGLLNRRFHGLLYTPCQNPLMTSMLEQVRDHVALVAVTWWAKYPTWEKEASEHEAILAAVRDGDAELAEFLMRRHVQSAASRILGEA